MKFLLKVRLSYYFFFLLLFYTALVLLLPRTKFDSSALMLFSVNSFLYGFYIAPILAAQKARIDELHKIIRAEANALFAMMIKTGSMSATHKHMYKQAIVDYVNSKLTKKEVDAGEKEYETLITTCLKDKTTDTAVAHALLDQLISNQANRSNFAMQMGGKVFSNEWWIILVLFSITLSFVLLIDTGDGLFVSLVKIILCSGLSMLLVILVKLSTLTHKRAKAMWQPLHKLVDSDFYRID
jgi:hypothetical protein